MQFKTEPGRIYCEDETGALLAEVTFSTGEDGAADITHTFVDPKLRGQGAAEQLMTAVAEQLRQTGQKARPTCTYARAWFSAHPEQADLLAEGVCPP